MVCCRVGQSETRFAAVQAGLPRPKINRCSDVNDIVLLLYKVTYKISH